MSVIVKVCALEELEKFTSEGWKFERIVEDEVIAGVNINKARFVNAPPPIHGIFPIQQNEWKTVSLFSQVVRKRVQALVSKDS